MDLTPIIIASAVLVFASSLVALISAAMRSVEDELRDFCELRA